MKLNIKKLIRDLCPPVLWRVGKKIKYILGIITGKNYYSCDYIQRGINLYPDNIVTICCASLEKEMHIANLSDLSEDLGEFKDLIFKKKAEMIEAFKKNKIYEHCKGCVYLKKTTYNYDEKIHHISLNHYMNCNLKCVFCEFEKRFFEKSKDTNHKLVLKLIKKLYADGMLSENFFVGIGGGEPSISKDLIEVIEYIISLGGNVHINTNAAKFSEVFSEGMKNGKIKILISADAGSKDVYTKIKGADYFDKAWENIGKYIDYIGEDNDKKIEVKFILQPDNISDINNMIGMCVKTKVKNVVCDMDAFIKSDDYHIYKKPIAEFKKLCGENNLDLRKGLFLPDKLW